MQPISFYPDNFAAQWLFYVNNFFSIYCSALPIPKSVEHITPLICFLNAKRCSTFYNENCTSFMEEEIQYLMFNLESEMEKPVENILQIQIDYWMKYHWGNSQFVLYGV